MIKTRNYIDTTRAALAASESDRCKQYIALTRKGAALVRKADRVADHMEEELLGHLSELEKTLLFQLLEKVAIRRDA